MAITINGSAQAIASSASSIAANLTTTLTNDLIVAVITNELQATSRTVTSVTATGLTFTKRSALAGTFSNNNPTNSNGDLEVWTAPSTGTLSAKTITANFSGAMDDACLVVFAVNGLHDINDPFDSNVSLPAISNAPNTTAYPAEVISTGQADDIIFYFNAGYSAFRDSPSTLPSGFTLIQTAANGGGVLSCGLQVGYKIVSATQSNLTVQGIIANAVAPTRNIACADVMTADVKIVTVQVSAKGKMQIAGKGDLNVIAISLSAKGRSSIAGKGALFCSMPIMAKGMMRMASGAPAAFTAFVQAVGNMRITGAAAGRYELGVSARGMMKLTGKALAGTADLFLRATGTMRMRGVLTAVYLAVLHGAGRMMLTGGLRLVMSAKGIALVSLKGKQAHAMLKGISSNVVLLGNIQD